MTPTADRLRLEPRSSGRSGSRSISISIPKSMRAIRCNRARPPKLIAGSASPSTTMISRQRRRSSSIGAHILDVATVRDVHYRAPIVRLAGELPQQERGGGRKTETTPCAEHPAPSRLPCRTPVGDFTAHRGRIRHPQGQTGVEQAHQDRQRPTLVAPHIGRDCGARDRHGAAEVRPREEPLHVRGAAIAGARPADVVATEEQEVGVSPA